MELTPGYVYWKDGERIVRVARAGGAIEEVLAPTIDMVSFGVDDACVYATVTNVGILRAPVTGGPPETFVGADLAPGAFDLIVEGGVVYYTQVLATGGGAFSIPAEGGVPTLLAPIDYAHTILPFGDLIYVSSGVTGLYRVARTGGAPEPLSPDRLNSFVIGTMHLFMMSVDIEGGISRVPLAGGASEQIVAPYSPDLAIAVAVDATHLYFTTADATSSALLRAGLDGTNPVLLATGVDPFTNLRLDDQSIYVLENRPGGGAVLSVPKCGCP